MKKTLLIVVTTGALFAAGCRSEPSQAASSPVAKVASAQPAFVLSDQSAEERAMSTDYVAGRVRRNPQYKFFCTSEMPCSGGIEVYFGMDCDDHTVRQAFLLVKPDGRVYRNTGCDFADKDWVEIH